MHGSVPGRGNAMGSFYARLQEATRPARSGLLSVPQLVRGARGNISRETYIAFLVQAYHHVRHTVPLLMACGSRLAARQEWLREAVATYIQEETGHQEWILDDIRACGVDPEPYRYGIPNASTELMVAYAYDTINRGNPVGFFGMVFVLEGTSIALATQAAGAIRTALQLPPEAFSYLTSHGALDIGHMDFFQALMNRIEDTADQQAIIHTADMMYRLYGDVFLSLPLD
jgi:pyrroloquinoline quinone (PQQ) biosynthesis protein C